MPTILNVIATPSYGEGAQAIALDVLVATAAAPGGRDVLRAAAVGSALGAFVSAASTTAALRRTAAKLLADLSSVDLPTTRPPVAATPRPAHLDLRSLSLSLAGGALVGVDRATEDSYVRSLLLLDGITSVTLDRRAEAAVVYYAHVAGGSAEEEAEHVRSLRGRLGSALQGACDAARDAAGRPRIQLTCSGRSGYLDEDEDKENERGADQGWGGRGGGFGTALVEPGGGAYGSAADRLMSKGAVAAGGGGWLPTAVSGWLGW